MRGTLAPFAPLLTSESMAKLFHDMKRDRKDATGVAEGISYETFWHTFGETSPEGQRSKLEARASKECVSASSFLLQECRHCGGVLAVGDKPT